MRRAVVIVLICAMGPWMAGCGQLARVMGDNSLNATQVALTYYNQPRDMESIRLVGIGKVTLEAAFEMLTGIPISSEQEFIFIERLAHGGMSSGGVSLRFWRETAIPLLIERYNEILRK